MDVKEHFKALKQLADDAVAEQKHDHVPRHKADNDFLAGTIENNFEIGSRDHRLYAEQIEVCQARVPVKTKEIDK